MKIKSITRHQKTFTKFDIATNNQNFVANGIVVHNSNMRITKHRGIVYVGTRTNWVGNTPNNQFRMAYDYLATYSKVNTFLNHFPGYILYGEMYGNVQSYKYGLYKTSRFIAFDIRRPDGKYVDYETFTWFCHQYEIPQVPLVHSGLHNYQEFAKYASGPSLMPHSDNPREGIVVKPVQERYNEKFERLIYKIVSPEFK